MPNERERPEPLSDLVSRYMRTSGIAGRIQQATVLTDWPAIVGPEIAAVTQPLSISEDGTLFVAVKNNPWMTELTMMERDLLETLNHATGDRPIRKLRWTLMR